MDVVERLLRGLAVEPAVLPGRLNAEAPVGELSVRREVVALAVVGLDSLDAQLEDVAGELAPPVARGSGGEVHDRAGPHPPAADVRIAVRGLDVVTRIGAFGVVLRRLGVEALGLGVGRALAVDRLEIDPGRHPDHGPHAVLAHPPDQSGRVGELVGVEAPGVVLRLPGRVDHDRVEGKVRLPVAAPVVLDVVLVLVDVAALPVAVGPLGHQAGQTGLAEEGAQPGRGRRAGEDVHAQRAGGRPDREGRDVPGQVRLDAGARGLDPAPPSQPRRAARAPGRSRPAGCHPARGTQEGSPGPCSGGRRRAGRGGPAGRSRRPCRAPSPVTRSPSSSGQLTPSRSQSTSEGSMLDQQPVGRGGGDLDTGRPGGSPGPRAPRGRAPPRSG